jgi:Tol biopolymer transport system component
VLLAVLCLVGVVLPLTDAGATTPGANGAIAFKHYLDADRSTGAIVTVWPDGTHWKQVTRPSSGTVDDQPDWAPDGSLIAFRRCAPDAPCAIYTVRPDGTGLRRVTPTCSPDADESTCADESEVAFLPDSRHVLLTRATGRVRVLSDGEGWIEHSDIVVRDLATGHDHVVRRSRPFSGDNVEMVASPTGGRIVFLRSTSPLGQPASAHALFVVRWDGTHLRRLTPWSTEAGDHPDWSPDGRWILYRAPDHGDFLDSQLYVVHPDGRGTRQVTHVPSGTRLLSSSFSPDGRRIVFGRDGRGGEPDIFTMSVHGGPVHQVTYSPRWDSAPDWGPRRAG